MSKLRESPKRFSLRKEKYIERKTIENKLDDPNTLAMLDFFNFIENDTIELENNIEWQKDNLEYDLRTNDYIFEKCKNTKYAQNLYAALCNNYFMKNDIWTLLKEKTWSCSWRHAAAIIANIQQNGDYIDWYCSGISSASSELTEKLVGYVDEGFVTEEIRNDLEKLGWLVVTESMKN